MRLTKKEKDKLKAQAREGMQPDRGPVQKFRSVTMDSDKGLKHNRTLRTMIS
jgi:hypothetical protein